jgi:hypothetical protein
MHLRSTPHNYNESIGVFAVGAAHYLAGFFFAFLRNGAGVYDVYVTFFGKRQNKKAARGERFFDSRGFVLVEPATERIYRRRGRSVL